MDDKLVKKIKTESSVNKTAKYLEQQNLLSLFCVKTLKDFKMIFINIIITNDNKRNFLFPHSFRKVIIKLTFKFCM